MVKNFHYVHNNLTGYIQAMQKCQTEQSLMQSSVDGWAYVYVGINE